MEEQRRINDLNAEYEKPTFSSRLLMGYIIICGIGIAAISGVLLS